MVNWIKNIDELANTENRKLALSIALAGFTAINTEVAVSNAVKLQGDVLSICGHDFSLSKYKNIKVVGFGKASTDAALALEKVLGAKIKDGAVIGLSTANCEFIKTFAGTHPRPTKINIDAGEKIYEILKDSDENDLIISLVSGGGSALLCYSQSECDQNSTLYDRFLKGGGTIKEINTIRKHLSILKGGGVAKIAYPATVVGLIFSDIPGDHYYDVASGPTYKDKSTIADAEAIIKKYDLGQFDLLETTKEDKYFEKVHNFVLVSNKTATDAMKVKAEELGLKAEVISNELYDEVSSSLTKIFKAKSNNTVILAAGEPMLEVTKKGGSGGRSLYMGLKAIQMGLISKDSVLLPLASDGMDNSDAAGAVVDQSTIEKINKLGIDVNDHIDRFDAYPVFQKSGDMIMTGRTGANVSDLMILLTKK